jgi:hypothetical protein
MRYGQSSGPPVLVMSASWRSVGSELSFVIRAIAGAASRSASVTVVTPMPSGPTVADGAFDLRGVGVGADGGWPEVGRAEWTLPPDGSVTWLIDDPTRTATALFETFGGGCTAYSVKSPAPAASSRVRPLPLLPGDGSEAVGVYVPVHPLATVHRHAGFGFAGYLLVLTDRMSAPAVEPPSPAVAWLSARFHRQYVVVVEGGMAAVWKGRALRGVVAVDTRMDLWRLMAHAWLTVDLAPGPVIARECVESLRYGTPIVVPDVARSASAHAITGGGLTFSGTPELLERVEQLLQPSERERFSRAAAAFSNSVYGDPTGFIHRVADALGVVTDH